MNNTITINKTIRTITLTKSANLSSKVYFVFALGGTVSIVSVNNSTNRYITTYKN